MIEYSIEAMMSTNIGLIVGFIMGYYYHKKCKNLVVR